MKDAGARFIVLNCLGFTAAGILKAAEVPNRGMAARSRSPFPRVQQVGLLGVGHQYVVTDGITANEVCRGSALLTNALLTRGM